MGNDNDSDSDKDIGSGGSLFSKLNPVEAVKPTVISIRKAMGRAGILEEQKDEELIKNEEIAILADLEAIGKKHDATSYERAKFAGGELFGNLVPGANSLITEELIDGRIRKAQIRASAEAIAKERGEKIPVPNNTYALSFFIVDSKPIQKIYRNYLEGVIAEEKAKTTPKEYPAFNNEHPSDHGGSVSHFQDKARSQDAEVSNAVAM